MIAALTSLTSALAPPEQDVSATTEFVAPAPPPSSPERERSQLSPPARLFAASLDTFEVLGVASMKLQVRCIRTSMDADEMASAPFTRSPRPIRRALDDAELTAPPDPPRYLRLTLDD